MYQKGAVVWVKLKSPFEWWPGQVEKECKKWTVTFWSDKTWEVVSKREKIHLFESSIKKTLIRAGLERFRGNDLILTKFIKDVWEAEKRNAGRLDGLYAYLTQSSNQLKLKTKTLDEIKVLYNSASSSNVKCDTSSCQLREDPNSALKRNSLCPRTLIVRLKRIQENEINTLTKNTRPNEEYAVTPVEEEVTPQHKPLDPAIHDVNLRSAFAGNAEQVGSFQTEPNIETSGISDVNSVLNASLLPVQTAHHPNRHSTHQSKLFSGNADEQLGVFQAEPNIQTSGKSDVNSELSVSLLPVQTARHPNRHSAQQSKPFSGNADEQVGSFQAEPNIQTSGISDANSELSVSLSPLQTAHHPNQHSTYQSKLYVRDEGEQLGIFQTDQNIQSVRNEDDLFGIFGEEPNMRLHSVADVNIHLPHNRSPVPLSHHASYQCSQLSEIEAGEYCIFQDEQRSIVNFAERFCSFQSPCSSENSILDSLLQTNINESPTVPLSKDSSTTDISLGTPNANEISEDTVYEELAPLLKERFELNSKFQKPATEDMLTDEYEAENSDDSEYEPDAEEPETESEDSSSDYNEPNHRNGPCSKRIRIEAKKPSDEKGDSALSFASCYKNDSGKRIYDKGHSCYFCGKEISKLARHILGVHKNEAEVARAAALKVGCWERKRHLEMLLRLGDFYHNMDVLASKKGCIIPLRRPSESEAKRYTYKDYGPCPDCLGFVVLNDLHRHSQRCPSRKVEKHLSDDEDETFMKSERRRIKTESILLMLPALSSIHEQGFQDLLASMRLDTTSDTIKRDPLIQQLGYHLYEKFSDMQKSYISQTMRMMGRLLRTVQQQEKKPLLTLETLIDASLFDKLISATRTLCKGKIQKSKRCEIGIPSLALKIGYNIRKCATLLKGKALRNKDYELRMRADDFLQLFDLEWTVRISSNALNTLYERKQNKPVELPLTSDLVALSKYQTKELQRLSQKLNEGPDTDAWYRLAEMSLSRPIVFNKRRSGEVSKILLSEYVNLPNWKGTRTAELEQSLSNLEKRLCNTLCLLKIRGKKGGKVPVLIPPEVKIALDALVTHRNKVGVSQNNFYLFARPYHGSKDYLRGNECLNSVKRGLKLLRPELITGTRLRKYIATVVQVFSLEETEVDWLARHLGHDIRVHREYYRLHESTAELAKVSRLLMAVDSGQASKWTGKSLKDINFEDSTDEIEQQLENSTTFNQRLCKNNSATNQESTLQKEINDRSVTDDDLMQESESENERCSSPPQRKTSASRVKRKSGLVLTPQHKSFIREYFRSSIKKHKVPGKADCEKCLKENAKLFTNLKDYLPIKWCVYNYIATCRRQMRKS